MTHRFHRENDPEYPQLLGELLDPDFAVDAGVSAPLGGGFLTGGGTRYRVGNFGHQRGTDGRARLTVGAATTTRRRDQL